MAKTKNSGKKKSTLSLTKKNAIKKKVTNPFEVHINRQKYEVLGRKAKNDRGLPGVARAKAIKKRKETLMQEYRVKDKTNKFMDRRIGEKNRAMTGEDRIMARFAAERMKTHTKKSMYNLADDEVLTHHGQTLNELEKFDDPRSDDEDEVDEGKLDAKFVKEAHFGGGILSKSSNPQNRKTIIEQLIADSKKRKSDQKKAREQTQELTDKLNSEWKDLLPLIATCKRKPDDAVEAVERPDEYDTMMRELRFEARGKPTDRLKSEDEIAREEKDRLEQLEADRIQRMHGITEADKPRITHRSADDLDDDFAMDSDEDENIVSYDADGKLEKRSSSQDQVEEMYSDEEESKSEDEASESEESSDSEGDDDLADMKSDSEAEEVEPSQRTCDMETESSVRYMSPESDNESMRRTIEVASDSEVSRISRRSERVKQQRVERVKQPRVEGVKEEEIEWSGHDVESRTQSIEGTSRISSLIEEQAITPEPGTMEVTTSLTACTSPKSDSTNVASDSETTKISEPNEQLQECKVEGVTGKPMRPGETEQESKKKSQEIENIRKDLLARKEMMETARKELPYTFKVPESYDALQELMSERGPEYQAVILERIVKCSHPSLAVGNRDKLTTLLAYLLQHLHDKATQDDGQCFVVLDRLASHLYDLAIMSPGNARRCVAEVLKEKQNDFRKNRREFPQQDTLVFLKLISLLFPTSDFRHPVTTPAFVFMGQMLAQCRVKTRRDIATGLFVATLLLEYTVMSKRFSPEVVAFLYQLLSSALSGKSASRRKLMCISPDYTHSTLPALLSLNELSTEEEVDDSFRYRALTQAAGLLQEFVTNLYDLPAVYQIFAPIATLKVAHAPLGLREQVERIQTTVKTMKARSMPRLIPESKKPKVLRLYEPKIEKVFDGRRHKVMSRERQEQAKLLHKVKRETKGAMREIRRDRNFVAKLKLRQIQNSDMERKNKVKQIYAAAAEQQGELNSIARKKK